MRMRWTRRSGAGIGAAALLALAFPGNAAADEPTCGGAELDPQALVVSLTTALGEVCIELFEDTAPGHVENFLWYLDHEAIEGSFFHRSVPGFIIQGGRFSRSRAGASKHSGPRGRRGRKRTL